MIMALPIRKKAPAKKKAGTKKKARVRKPRVERKTPPSRLPGIIPLSLRDLAATSGYTPGEFLLRRMGGTKKLLVEYVECSNKGVVHPEFIGKTFYEFHKIVQAEIKDFEKDELRILDFFYPKMRSTELTGQGGGALEMSLRVGFPKGYEPEPKGDAKDD